MSAKFSVKISVCVGKLLWNICKGGGGVSPIHYSVEEHKTSKSNELIC